MEENIKNTFHLPISYQETTKINDNIKSDLELLKTKDDETKPAYNHLFNPTTGVGNLMLESWGDKFTNNKQFLLDSQNIMKNYNIDQDSDIVNKTAKDWYEIKNIEDIEEKYQYIEWDRLKWLNYNPFLLQILSFINITSPVLQLLTPIFMLIVPFFFLKLMGKNITMDNYINILKQVISRHQIGQVLTSFSDASIKTKLYGLLMLAFYLYSVYQNIISCYHFYMNSYYIVDKIQSLKNYLKYTRNNMEKYYHLTKDYASYQTFRKDMDEYKIEIDNFIEELEMLPEKTRSFKTVKVFGLIMKYFYRLHYDDHINKIVCYSLGFNGYIDTLCGLKNNILNNNINSSKFTKKNNSNFKEIYHPSLKDKSPIKNNVNLDKSIILTGPNAAGKTTLLKSSIINIIFTQQTGFGFYKKGILNPYKFIHSYINIPDSCSRDSLFQSEARRCKNILDIINKNKNDRHFCVFDELYSGTNPYEAVSNAYGYLNYLIKNKNVKIILTTHYIKLCKLFRKNKNIKNYNMETFINNHISKNTYKMVSGYSKTKGGIAVLKSLDYPENIIKEAEKILKNI